MKKLSAIAAWAIIGFVGLPLLIVLVWLLSPDDDVSAAGVAVLALAFSLLVCSAIALLRFVVRS